MGAFTLLLERRRAFEEAKLGECAYKRVLDGVRYLCLLHLCITEGPAPAIYVFASGVMLQLLNVYRYQIEPISSSGEVVYVNTHSRTNQIKTRRPYFDAMLHYTR